MEEEYYRIKIGDMYVKYFKMATVIQDDNRWQVKSELTLTNIKEEGIPILEKDAENLGKLLDEAATLEPFEGEKIK